MLVLLLFFIFILLTIISYYILGKDIIAPPVIFCAMYTLSIGMALTQWKEWNLSDYSIAAFNTYVWGAILFIFIAFCVKKAISIVSNNDDIKLQTVNFNRTILIIFIIIDIIILYLLYRGVKSIGGSGSFSQIMEQFRQQTSYSFDVQLPNYLQQLLKLTNILAYICGFLLINNILVRGFERIDFLLIIPLIIYLLSSVLQSNRLVILEIIGALGIYYFLLRAVKYKNKGISFKLIVIIILIFLLVLLGFYAIRLLIGRNGSKETGIVDYLSMYMGGSVKLFDLYLKNPIRSDIWGKETFYGLVRNLNSWGIMDTIQYLPHKEFRMVNGISLGNVYTAYRSYFADFGWPGVICLQTIFSLFYSFLYYILRRSKYYNHKLAIIIYGYIATPIFLHPIQEEFFNLVVNMGFLTYLILFWIIYVLLVKKIRL